MKVMKLILALILAALAAPAFAQASDQSFVPAYYPAKNPRNAATIQRLKEAKVLENYTAALSKKIKLPTKVHVTFAECGFENAMYQANTRLIIFCVELFDKIQNLARSDLTGRRLPPGLSIQDVAWGAVTFVLVHEVGHALVDVLDVAALGREEDVADQIATYLLLEGRRPEAYIWSGIWFFKGGGLFYFKSHLADEHSLNSQRRYNVACWAFGSNPARYQKLARDWGLPQARAQRCPTEFQQLNDAVKRLIGAHIRPSQPGV